MNGTKATLIAAIILLGGLQSSNLQAQHFAVKTNAVYWTTLSPNMGVEFAMSHKMSLDLALAYKPWTIRSGTNIRFWGIQPEWRYWLYETFEGHFFGMHFHGAQYYARHTKQVYDGYLIGVGFTYGYDWILTPRWNLEILIGVGYARLQYKKRPDLPCAKCAINKNQNYAGPTKMALSVAYLF